MGPLWLGLLTVNLASAAPAVVELAEDARPVQRFGFARLLADASSNNPTVDEVENVIFSRPPGSAEKTSSIVYIATAAFYMLCAIVLLVAANLDASERRGRRARAIVPEESVPCAIAEQYYLDEHLVNMRSSQDFESRKTRKGFCTFLLHYGVLFPDALSRQHLCLSLLVQAIPTFTRLKRGLLIVVQLHLCMLTSAFAYNGLEHDKPKGRYEMISCNGQLITPSCTATLPMSLLAAGVTYPIFRFVACRQMRLTCFTSQLHPSSSQFPLNVRKFARIPAKSAWESVFCMRNAYERRQVMVLNSRSLAHRVVQLLWRTTQPSAKDLRFYSVVTSRCILFATLSFIFFSLFYMIMFTAYLQDEVVYHWLAWTLTMFCSSVLVLEPLQILFVEVIWCAFIANLAQRWCFGAHALAGTTRYKEVVRTVEQVFIKKMRHTAASRIQRWWLAVLEMYRAIKEHTSTAVNFQAITEKNIHQKKYVKERKWCLRVEVQDCYDLEQVQSEGLMSPLIRLQCDVGNLSVLQTKVAWDAHKRAPFNEIFFMDIKESQAIYVSVWSKTPMSDEFIGRGYFDFKQVKSVDREKPGGQDFKVMLQDIEHGALRSRIKKVCGYVNLNVQFLDPSKEPIGEGSEVDDTGWMLPKHRMQFSLSKTGGRIKVSKMLGALGTPMMQPVTMKVPTWPLKLDSPSGWTMGAKKSSGSTVSRSNNNASTPHTPAATAPFRNAPTSQPEPATSRVAAATEPAAPLPPPPGPPPGRTDPVSLTPPDPGSGAQDASLPGAVHDSGDDNGDGA